MTLEMMPRQSKSRMLRRQRSLRGLDEPLGYPDGLNAYTVEVNSPTSGADPMGLASQVPTVQQPFTLDVWKERNKDNGEYKDAITVTITATGENLHTAGKKGKLTITMKMEEGQPGYGVAEGTDGMRKNITGADSDLQGHKTYGGFVVAGVEVPWDVGETKEMLSEHPHSATAVKVMDLAECPVGEQKGTVDIWLWGEQQMNDLKYTGIVQTYKLEWSYEYGKDGTKKAPFKATITLTGNDPLGDLKVPKQYTPPENGQHWPQEDPSPGK